MCVALDVLNMAGHASARKTWAINGEGRVRRWQYGDSQIHMEETTKRRRYSSRERELPTVEEYYLVKSLPDLPHPSFQKAESIA
jgi:hypothetical protein